MPSIYGVAQLLVLSVVELELLTPQATELAEHVGEDAGQEAALNVMHNEASGSERAIDGREESIDRMVVRPKKSRSRV